MTTIQDQIAQARAAGYSDDEIAKKLATIPGYSDKIKTAQGAGYATSDIVSHLSGGDSAAKSNPFAGARANAGAMIDHSVDDAKHNVSSPNDPNPSKDSFWQQVNGTLIETPLAIGSGIVGGVVGPVVGVAKNIINGGYGTAEGANNAERTAGQVADAITYHPRTETGKFYPQQIGKAINDSGIMGVPVPVLNDLAAGASSSAAALRNVGVANSVRSAAAPVVDSMAAVGSKVAPSVSPKVAALAEKAQAFGIDLRPDMLMDNKFVKIIGDTLEKIPLSNAKGESRQIAFNRALNNMIGGDPLAARITPDVFAGAMKKSGSKIGEIADRTPIPLDDNFNAVLDAHLESLKYETDSTARIVANRIEEIKSKAIDGVIPGETFRKLNSQLGKQASKTADGDLKYALGELEDSLQSQIQRNATPADVAELADARKKYAIGKTIEPLIAKSPIGDISPAGLMARATADKAGKTRMAMGNGGDLGDLAKVGQQFLKEPASSGTTERAAAYTTLGGAGAVSPYAAGGVWGGAALYNTLGPRIANSMINKFSDAARAADIQRAFESNVSAPSRFRQRVEQQRLKNIGSASSISDAISAAAEPNVQSPGLLPQVLPQAQQSD